MELSRAANKESFDEIRKKISLSDYEFFYTSRSQADFTDPQVYKNLVGDFDQGFYTYFKERDGVVINTIHGIKGEEYTVVIGYDLLNGHLPNWNIIKNKNETLKLLYVLCSRAKSALYLFSETGRTTRTGHPLTSTNELYNVRYHYDTA